MTHLDWNETKNIMLEVEQLFSREDDIRDVHDIKKMAIEIDMYCGHAIKDAKELIKQLANKVASKEQEISTSSEAMHAHMVEDLDKENQSTINEIKQLRDKIETKKIASIQLRQQILEITESPEKDLSTLPDEDSRTAYALSLYGKISNISWDYGAPNGRLAGFINSDDNQKMVPFDVDAKSMTPYETANVMWDLIGRVSDDMYYLNDKAINA